VRLGRRLPACDRLQSGKNDDCYSIWVHSEQPNRRPSRMVPSPPPCTARRTPSKPSCVRAPDSCPGASGFRTSAP